MMTEDLDLLDNLTDFFPIGFGTDDSEELDPLDDSTDLFFIDYGLRLNCFSSSQGFLFLPSISTEPLLDLTLRELRC